MDWSSRVRNSLGGGSNVTVDNGFKLDNGDKLSIIIGDREALYAIAGSGTHNVGVLAQK